MKIISQPRTLLFILLAGLILCIGSLAFALNISGFFIILIPIILVIELFVFLRYCIVYTIKDDLFVVTSINKKIIINFSNIAFIIETTWVMVERNDGFDNDRTYEILLKINDGVGKRFLYICNERMTRYFNDNKDKFRFIRKIV